MANVTRTCTLGIKVADDQQNLNYTIADYLPTKIKAFFGALLDLQAEGYEFAFEVHTTEYAAVFNIDCFDEEEANAVRNAWDNL